MDPPVPIPVILSTPNQLSNLEQSSGVEGDENKVEVVFHGPLPPIQRAPGLEALSSAIKLFTIRYRKNPGLPLHGNLPPMAQIFKIHNARAEHILTAMEVRQPPFFFLPQWKTQIYICTTSGDPLLLITQRNEGIFVGTQANQLYEACYRADRYIQMRSHDDKATFDELPSYVHLQLLGTGKFLGHFFHGRSSTAILDANFVPIFTFKMRDTLIDSLTKTEDGGGGNEEDEEEADLIASRGKNMTRRPDSITSEGAASDSGLNVVQGKKNSSNYDLVEENQQVGAVESHTSWRNMLRTTPSEDCFTCTFPREFTQVDKALVLSFVLCKQTMSSYGEYFVHILMIIVIIIVVGLTIIAVILAIFYRFDSSFGNNSDL